MNNAELETDPASSLPSTPTPSTSTSSLPFFDSSFPSTSTQSSWKVVTTAQTPPTTPTKSTTKATNLPSLVGYIKNVSPTKVSSKGSEYFSFQLQQKDRFTKAVCFQPKKHKLTVQAKAESATPCKLTKYAPHATEENVIWVNSNTEIHDALETTVDFSSEDLADHPSLISTTQDLNDIQVHQSVTVCGFISFGDNNPEPVPTKQDLIKREGIFIDQHGTIRITVWNEQTDSVQEGFYQVQNARLRQYCGEKYLSSSTDTTFNKIDDLPQISPDALQDARATLTIQAIPFEKLHSIDINTYYSCVTCKKKVPFQCGSSMLRCPRCQSRFLVENSTKTINARISIKRGEEISWYTLFPSHLEGMLHHYNNKCGANEVLATIDEDTLCNIFLLQRGMEMKVNSKGNVVGITFN